MMYFPDALESSLKSSLSSPTLPPTPYTPLRTSQRAQAGPSESLGLFHQSNATLFWLSFSGLGAWELPGDVEWEPDGAYSSTPLPFLLVWENNSRSWECPTGDHFRAWQGLLSNSNTGKKFTGYKIPFSDSPKINFVLSDATRRNLLAPFFSFNSGFWIFLNL